MLQWDAFYINVRFLRMGSCLQAIFVAMFDTYSNEIPFLKVPEVVVKACKQVKSLDLSLLIFRAPLFFFLFSGANDSVCITSSKLHGLVKGKIIIY
ncbi:unnamed protein product [Lactuca virosa]|uniref:Uncharacterized protein n=1 Tax=Lactuca virosa TaxID=75947 RepID=A0AAU9PRS5_9ASTR|nr:unnamed protein product [Lactuca virosa]